MNIDLTLVPSSGNLAEALQSCEGIEPNAAVGIDARPIITKQVVLQSHTGSHLYMTSRAQFLAENQKTKNLIVI